MKKMNNVNVVKIIERKSLGLELISEEIENFVKCVADKLIDDAQIGAFLMAVKLKGMTPNETADLTKSMAKFSYKFEWSKYEWKNKVVDKHSTGGVGDKISHILAPILSACGLKIPMISGRGLGITGGTIDKLEAIEGFLPIEDFQIMPQILENAGFFITGQTETMIPVDKRLYAIRDVTATIDSIPLITASILSKKKIEDIQILLMDIKFGKGTFMKTEKSATELARSMIDTGKSLNMNIICVIDDMNSPLGCCIGNALEIAETLKALNGNMSGDIKELVYIMATQLLRYTNPNLSEDGITKKIDDVITSGLALEKLREMLIYQGVDKKLAEKLCAHEILSIENYLNILNRKSSRVTEIEANNKGYIHCIDAEIIGLVTRDLGGGRLRKEDKINYGVGIELICKEGIFVENGQLWARVYHDEELSNNTIDFLQSSIIIKSDKPRHFQSRIKTILTSQ